MVVNGRHFKNTAARRFKAGDLENHRHRLHDKNAADNHEQEFLFAADRDCTQHSADRQRAGIAHEDAGRMGIPPEEAQAGSQQRDAEDGQLPGIGNEGHLKVGCCLKITRHIHEHGIGRRHGRGASCRKPVQSVCEVHRVGCAHDDEEVENKCQNAHAK